MRSENVRGCISDRPMVLGLHHLVWEIVDNAVDEALSGFGDRIDVTINKDGSLTVQDHGRGMPTGMHAMGIPTVEVIFTILHAGGKFGQGGYKTSGGLHGVGSSVVNALSSWLEVEIIRDGAIYKQRFENGGKPVTTLKKIGTAPKSKTGTKVTFMPDATIFLRQILSTILSQNVLMSQPFF